MNNVIPFPTRATVFTDDDVCWVFGTHMPVEITDEDSTTFWSAS